MPITRGQSVVSMISRKRGNQILKSLTTSLEPPQVTPEETPGPQKGKRLGSRHNQPGVFVSVTEWAQQDLKLRFSPCEPVEQPRIMELSDSRRNLDRQQATWTAPHGQRQTGEGTGDGVMLKNAHLCYTLS